MNKSAIARPFTVDEISFRACLSAPRLELFAAMMVGWFLTVGRHTISNVILTMGLHESRHFAGGYRFVGQGRWLPDMVFRVVFELLVATVVRCETEIPAVVDDTVNKHRGKKICGAGWQHDGSATGERKRKGYGLCFVIIGLALRLDRVSNRFSCLPYAGRLWWPARAKVQPTTMA